jgi:uncharacterized protein YcaQ
MIELTQEQARSFMALLHFGDVRNADRDPVNELINNVRRLGCVQYDPLDVVGRNMDLVMQARIPGYRPEYFYEALYVRRALFDGYDKNLAVFPAEDFPFFARSRRETMLNFRENAEIQAVLDRVVAEVERRGELCSDDLNMNEKVRWAWSDTRLGRAALESLWTAGRLALSRRDGARRYFNLIERCLPESIINAPDPNPDDRDYDKWQMHRRIRSVGILTGNQSDALLGLNMNAARRRDAISALMDEGKILRADIPEIKMTCYISALDKCVLERALAGDDVSGMRIIAPLDNFMWDRKLILKLFGFYYRWEVYVPKAERRYGYYVLPLLHASRLVGRIEFEKFRGGRLAVKNIWWEDGVSGAEHESALRECLNDFCRYLGAEGWDIPEQGAAAGRQN